MSFVTRRVAIGLATTGLAASVLLRAQDQAPAPAQTQVSPAKIDFARDVQPIFEKYCAECHGKSKARAKLRLHAPEFIRRGGNSGAAITPGNSHKSLLINRVLDENEDDRMPLDADPLPADTIAVLRAWIDQGAQMPSDAVAADALVDEHWAYVKPKRSDLPTVSRDGWVRNPIDRFVLSRLDAEKLTPAPEAAKTTLLRRVSLDLTGLPPSPEELDRFLADSSPDAYERAVDRLLASPHYGERWARPWLDLARYADTNGFEKDNRRSIWKFRDWVIDALNQDMRFDRFTIEQIAGDMLPNATVEQKIASGFHRNAMTNEEGGVDPEESRYEVLVDRVNTTATVWLGTTLACAQCHNHKYDPFSQKDYFRFLAFFANADYDSRAVRRRHAALRADARSRHAGAGEGAQGTAGQDRSDRSGIENGDAGGARGAGTMGRIDAHRSCRLDATHAAQGRGHQRRCPQDSAGRVGARLGSQPAVDVVHLHR